MSGGTGENVMGFYQDENGNIRIGTTSLDSGFTGYVDTEIEKEGIPFPTDKKYYQLYQKTISDGRDLGDAIYETKHWDWINSSFINSDYPICYRGGNYMQTSYAWPFNLSGGKGQASSAFGFRVCLAIK